MIINTSRYSLFAVLAAAILSLAALIVISGCEGVSGPRGVKGPDGPDGPDYTPPVPENRFFSLAITNSAFGNHNGAPKLYLSFDGEHAAAGDTVVSVQLTNSDPRPSVDGVHGGVDEWGDVATTVALRKAAGDYNFIEEATVRSAFDNDFIYFQVQWSEVENAGFGLEVSRSDDPAYVVYPADSTWNPIVWDYDQGNEDRLLMLFEITDVTRYDVDGCMVTCHTDPPPLVESNYHATRAGGELMDVWTWGAGLTNPTGYIRDQVMKNTRGQNVGDDNGIPVVVPNQEVNIESGVVQFRRPIYQKVGGPSPNTEYPLWTWELAALTEAGWAAGARIPAFISIPTPSNSAGDVVARGTFDEATGTWTVEMRRLRRTGNGDDTQF